MSAVPTNSSQETEYAFYDSPDFIKVIENRAGWLSRSGPTWIASRWVLPAQSERAGRGARYLAGPPDRVTAGLAAQRHVNGMAALGGARGLGELAGEP